MTCFIHASKPRKRKDEGEGERQRQKESEKVRFREREKEAAKGSATKMGIIRVTRLLPSHAL